MATAKKLRVEPSWRVLLKDLGFDPADVLRAAVLPADLFVREEAHLTVTDFFRFWRALEKLSDDPLLPLKLGQSMTAETFTPPIFASLCSPDLKTALARLAQYKPLIGPMTMTVGARDGTVAVLLGGLPDDLPPPASLMAVELVFFTHLARLCTREPVKPAAVTMAAAVPQIAAYEGYFGCPVSIGATDGIAFSEEDARIPFLTANARPRPRS